jgi:hypothetical protein
MENKKCQICTHRGKDGKCRIFNWFVPRKRTIRGHNPANDCISFSRKGGKQ